MTEIETDFEQWTDLVVSSVRPQGTVSVGDELVVFETDKIDKAIWFLLNAQNPDGSFGSHVSSRPGEIYAPLPTVSI